METVKMIVRFVNVQAMVLFPDGYCTFPSKDKSNEPTFHYYTQDHLGNNRVVTNEDGTVEQITHYYPFGGTLQKYNYKTGKIKILSHDMPSDKNDPDRVNTVQSDFETKPLSNLDILNINKNILYEKY